MLRRFIASALLILVSVVVVPCGFASGHVETEPIGEHACCAPSAIASHSDCCGAIAPHPAIAPDGAEHFRGLLMERTVGSLALDRLPIQKWALVASPPEPMIQPPALILRT